MKLVVLSLTSILYIPLVTKAQNKLSRKEKKAGWTLLFDGKTTTGWRDAYKDTVPKASWKIVEGAMMVLPKREGETTGRGDIVTNKLYSNFELSIDFKLTEGTNSASNILLIRRLDWSTR